MLSPRRWVVPLLAREIPSFVSAQTVCSPADSQFLHPESDSYFDVALEHNFEEVVYFLGWPKPNVRDVILIADKDNSVPARLIGDQVSECSWLGDVTPGSIIRVQGSGVRISDCFDPPRVELHVFHLANHSARSRQRSTEEFMQAHKTPFLRKILAVCLQKQAAMRERMSTYTQDSFTSIEARLNTTFENEVLNDEDQIQSQFLTQLLSAHPPSVKRQPLAELENSNHEKRSLLSLLKPDVPSTSSFLNDRNAEESVRGSSEIFSMKNMETQVASTEQSVEPHVIGVAASLRDNKLPQSSGTIQYVPLGGSTLESGSTVEDSNLDVRKQTGVKSTAKQSGDLKKGARTVPLLQRLKISRMQKQPAHHISYLWASRITKAQARILDMEEAWQPPLPGKTLRQGTVPLDILERLTSLADTPVESMSHSTQQASPEKNILAVRDSITSDVEIHPHASVDLLAEQTEVIDEENAESEEDFASQWSSSPPQPKMPLYPLDSPIQQAETGLPMISDLESTTLADGHDTKLQTQKGDVHTSDCTQHESGRHDLLSSSPTPGTTYEKGRQGMNDADHETHLEEPGELPIIHGGSIESIPNVPVGESGISSPQSLVTSVDETLRTIGACVNTALQYVGLNAKDDEHQAKMKDSVVVESVERSTSEFERDYRVATQDLMDVTHDTNLKDEINTQHSHASSEHSNTRKRGYSELSLPDMSLVPKRRKTDSCVEVETSSTGHPSHKSQKRNKHHYAALRSDPIPATFSSNSTSLDRRERDCPRLSNANDQRPLQNPEQDRRNHQSTEEQRHEEPLRGKQHLDPDFYVTPDSRLYTEKQAYDLRFTSTNSCSVIPASSETDNKGQQEQPLPTQHSMETSQEIGISAPILTFVSPSNAPNSSRDWQTLSQVGQIDASTKNSAADTLCAIPSSSPWPARQSKQTSETAESALFQKFQKTYNNYRASMEQFVTACRILRRIQATGGSLHPSLFDDFIYRFHDEYDRYLKEVVGKCGRAVPYEVFYDEHIERPQYLQRVVRREDLKSLKFEAESEPVPVTAEEAIVTRLPPVRDLEQLPTTNMSHKKPQAAESGKRGRIADQEDRQVLCTPVKDPRPTVFASDRSSLSSSTSLPKRAVGEASPELGTSDKRRKLETVAQMDLDTPTSQFTRPQQQHVHRVSLYAEFAKQYRRLMGNRKAANQKPIVDIFSWPRGSA